MGGMGGWGGLTSFVASFVSSLTYVFVFLLLLSKYAESFGYICVSELCLDI